MKSSRFKALYDVPLIASRAGALFNAHWYPTKISPESIALMIACHTKPNDLVFDGFGGSGTTALATLLCSKPSNELCAAANLRGLEPIWGPRRAVVYELGGLGSFIGQTLCAQPDPDAFLLAANRILAEAERRYGWIYEALDSRGNKGVARYFIWSEFLECPQCGRTETLWDACVRFEPVRILDEWKCSSCEVVHDLSATPRHVEEVFDSLLGSKVRRKVRMLARVTGTTRSQHWSRLPTSHDLDIIKRVHNEEIAQNVPIVPMMGKGGVGWGDLWRAGYHEGITHVHQFYTRRNLLALAYLHELVEHEQEPIRNALRLWISSYNSSHSTLMTRVVAKQKQDELVLTSAQPGVLYISGLPVEKNIFLGLRRKLKTFTDAFSILRDLTGHVEVRQGSSIQTDLPDDSIDYVFTDPPFGGNIPYSEVSFISEAWLGLATAKSHEAIISQTQSKGIEAYETLLTNAFSEMRRILKPSGRATIVFHSTQSDVWGALGKAYMRAGFHVEMANILDKRQGSFKQVTTRNSAKGDQLILLVPKTRTQTPSITSPDSVIEAILTHLEEPNIDPDESTPQRLYSRFVSHYVQNHTPPPFDADEFYAKLDRARGLG